MPNGDGVLDGDEDHLADAEVGSDRRFSADFTVTSPPFVFGQGRTKNSSANKVNAVDSAGNSIKPSLPDFSADDIPTFRLITTLFNTRVERAFPNLSFRLQTNLLQPDDGTDRIYISELKGRILVFENHQDTKESHVFLDISDQIYSVSQEGLLGLAFDPNYKDNGQFYVFMPPGVPNGWCCHAFRSAPITRWRPTRIAS